MIQNAQILSELYGAGKSVVGFRQPVNPLYAILNAVNITSSSGVYLESGIVTIENIRACQDLQEISNANFNTVLERLIKDAITDSCNLVFSFEDQIESGLLYNVENVKTNTLANAGDFVGFEINCLKKGNISNIINSLITEFDAAGSLTIYLFHSSLQTAIQTKAITLTEKNAVETTAGWVLDKHKDFGGTYYIGYLTSGLTPKAMNRSNYYSYFPKDFKVMNFKPFKVTGWTSTSLFDIANVVYTSDSYGLNFNCSSFVDYTDYIISNKDRFANLIKYQFQANILDLIKSTNRSNGIEEKVRINATKELEGILTESGNVYSQGILRKLQNEAKRLRDEFFAQDGIKILNNL